MEADFSEKRGRYTEALRNMFAKINPYNLSCLYKETFETHAVETLRACGDVSHKHCMQAITNISEARYKSLSKQFETHQKCGLCLKDEIEFLPLFDEPKSTFSIDDFYEKMRLGTTNDNSHYDHEIMGWKTCKKAHVDSLDCIVKHVRDTQPAFLKMRQTSPKQNRSVLNRKQFEFNVMPPNLRICKNTFQGSSSEEGMNVFNEMRNERAIASANNYSTRSRYSKLDKSDSKKRDNQQHTNNNCKNLTSTRAEPTEQDDQAFKFYHNQSRSQYMEQYRRCFIQKDAESCCPPKNKFITKAAVQCQDVRKGACIEPNAAPPSVKLAHFHFKVNCKLRTSNPAIVKKKPATSPPVTTSEPPNMGAGITGVAVMTDLTTLSKSKSCTPSPVCSTPPLARSPNISPVICRSRPTIPSNARGIVCDTAIETPKYVIHGVKGHSFSGQKNGRMTSSSPNTSYRPPSEKNGRMTSNSPFASCRTPSEKTLTRMTSNSPFTSYRPPSEKAIRTTSNSPITCYRPPSLPSDKMLQKSNDSLLD